MLCEHCNKNVSTVHLIEIFNQEKKEVNLCESCAQEAGLPFSKPNLSVGDLFGLVQGTIAKSGRKREAEPECPDCGMTIREFRSKGRLGCPKDYQVFKTQLEGLLEKIHGSARHVGKAPAGSAAATVVKPAVSEELESLRKKLTQAVHLEKYEEAAKLRDRIQEIEKAAQGGPLSPESS